MRITAVVVAYDRRDLLVEALDALAAQTRPLDEVVVIDNASHDDSAVVAAAHPVGAEVLTLARNTGGAGGFAAGIAHAVARGADLVWLMDDDTIPTPTALAELLAARDAYPGPVALLGSRVVWHDGRDHPMNTPRRRPGASAEQIAHAREAGALPVRSSSFVSMLVDSRAIRHHGLPVADYFIWNDDFEYSARLLRRGTGLHVPASVVEHRTKTFGATDADPGARFYYEVRNKLWMLLWSRALSPAERVLYLGASLRRWVRTFLRSSDRGTLREAGARGLRDGLTTRPRSTEAVLAGLGPVSEDVAVVDASARGRTA
ncbi:MAG: glycosyl transferase [Cellulosimicrobium sp.]|jgi:GT2 family glycosyltransferase|nr:glycosyl transferase [Cellulosimicrobium sp.]